MQSAKGSAGSWRWAGKLVTDWLRTRSDQRSTQTLVLFYKLYKSAPVIKPLTDFTVSGAPFSISWLHHAVHEELSGYETIKSQITACAGSSAILLTAKWCVWKAKRVSEHKIPWFSLILMSCFYTTDHTVAFFSNAIKRFLESPTDYKQNRLDYYWTFINLHSLWNYPCVCVCNWSGSIVLRCEIR